MTVILGMPDKIWSLRSRFYALRDDGNHPYGEYRNGAYNLYANLGDQEPSWSTNPESLLPLMERVVYALTSNGKSLRRSVMSAVDETYTKRLSSANARVEYMLRVKYTIEYRCLKSLHRENLDGFFDGALSGLESSAMYRVEDGTLYWCSGELYRLATSEERDEQYRLALDKYNEWYSNSLYTSAVAQFGDHDAHRWGNLLSDSALAICGSPYHENVICAAAQRLGADLEPINSFLEIYLP